MVMLRQPRRSGGMADAPDSKSGPRKWVWVQVPPSAVTPHNWSPEVPSGSGYRNNWRSGMVRCVAAVLAVGLLLTANDANKDNGQIQGTWLAVTAERGCK